MERFLTAQCSREDVGVLMRNVWRILRVGSRWICIREPNVWVSVIPGPDERCTAIVEILDQRPDGFQEGDQECATLVQHLFPEIALPQMRG